MAAVFKWWFIFWSIVVGCIITQYTGLFEVLWKIDATKVSYVCLALFAVVTVFIGVLTKRVQKSTDNVKAVQLQLSPLWFSTEAMNALGMIGTVAGFLIMMMTTFGHDINVGSPDAVKQMIVSAALGMSTSASATLVGLICSTLTKLQLVNLEKLIDEVTQ